MNHKHWKRHACGWRHGRSGGSASAAWGEGGFGGRNFRILSGLHRDPWNGRVSGVCAGIAGYYGLNVGLIRAAMVIAGLFNPFLTIGGYIIATFLLRPLPEPQVGGRSEMNAGTSAHAEDDLSPELRFAALKDKFRELEERTGEIETLVTSSEFRLRRDFKKMGEGKGEDGSDPRPQFGAGPAGRPPMMGLIG